MQIFCCWEYLPFVSSTVKWNIIMTGQFGIQNPKHIMAQRFEFRFGNSWNVSSQILLLADADISNA